MCDCSSAVFTARASRTKAGAREFRAAGTCTCPTTRFELALAPDNPGIVPQPEEVALKLIVSKPLIGTGLVIPTPLSYKTEIGDEAVHVTIRGKEDNSLVVPISGDSYGGSEDLDSTSE